MASTACLLIVVSAIITQIALSSAEKFDTLDAPVNKEDSDEANPDNSSCEYNCPITLNCTEWSHCAFHYPDLCEGTLRCMEQDDSDNSTRRKPKSSLLLIICIPFIFFIILLQILTQKGFMLLNLDGAGITKAKLQRIQELNRVTVCKVGESDIKTKEYQT